jgi:hypothetical protein
MNLFALGKVIGAIMAIVIWFDFLFWGFWPGLSLGLFCGGLVGLLLALEPPRPWYWRHIFLILGFMATLGQSAWQLGFSNITLLIIFTLLLGADRLVPEAGGWLTTLGYRMMALVSAPLGWSWLWREFEEARLLHGKSLGHQCVWLLRMLSVPLLILLLLALPLVMGNGVLKVYGNAFWGWLWNLLWAMDFHWGRWFCWGLIGTLALGFILPARRLIRWLEWLNKPSAPAPVSTIGWWRQWIILIGINGLFLGANTVDVLYLWFHAALPSHLSFGAFIHEGVYSLIFATLLCGLTLLIFNPQTRGQKILAAAAILQNGLLISGVGLRLKLYVEAYQLSTLRLYVAGFLILVILGFALLLWRVWREKSCSWFLQQNALVVILYLFVLQFLPVNGWVINYNVRQAREEQRELDVDYIATLGPEGWRCLQQLSLATENTPQKQAALKHLMEWREWASTCDQSNGWRSWQGHREAVVRELGWR